VITMEMTPPNLDALCGPDLVPLAWHEWTSEERGKYANQVAFNVWPDWEPPVVACSGCGQDRPDWRWMLARHRAGGWWHTATCMPPSDWQGFVDPKEEVNG
jgi:hypothetical protein